MRRLSVASAMLGLILTLIPLGNAGAEEFRYPVDVVADKEGKLFVADSRLPGIWTVEENQLKIFLQASKKFREPLNGIRCLAIDGEGLLLAGDSATREVYRIDASGEPHPLTDGGIGIPVCLAVSPDGNIFVSDLETRRIWKIPPSGGIPEEFAVLAAVRGMAFDEDGGLWVVRSLSPSFGKIEADGTFQPVLEERTFEFPHQLAIGSDGTAYVADGYAGTIWKVSREGNAEPWISGEPLVSPVGLAWRDDVLVVADSRARALFGIGPQGAINRLLPAD